MNFEWTQEALNSLRIIEHYVSDIAGEKIGKSFTRKLFLKASTLIEFPQIGRAVPQFFDPRFREVFEGSYRIVYRLNSVEDPSEISVLGVFHSSQLLENTSLSGLFDE